MQLQQAFVTATANVINQIVTFLPTLIAALIVFLLGLIVANWLRWFTVKLLKAVRLSHWLAGTGLETFLKKAEVTTKVEEVVGATIRWLVVLVFFVTTVNLLGLTPVSDVLSAILGYIPTVVSAALILGIGVVVAGLLESVVKGALGSLDVKAARVVGKVTSYLVVVFASLAAISELGIAQQFITAVFYGAVGMLALGLGLAIGLGGKDIVAQILKDWYAQLKPNH